MASLIRTDFSSSSRVLKIIAWRSRKDVSHALLACYLLFPARHEFPYFSEIICALMGKFCFLFWWNYLRVALSTSSFMAPLNLFRLLSILLRSISSSIPFILFQISRYRRFQIPIALAVSTYFSPSTISDVIFNFFQMPMLYIGPPLWHIKNELQVKPVQSKVIGV